MSNTLSAAADHAADDLTGLAAREAAPVPARFEYITRAPGLPIGRTIGTELAVLPLTFNLSQATVQSASEALCRAMPSSEITCLQRSAPALACELQARGWAPPDEEGDGEDVEP